ncbi:MAG TPA: hypothetical protein VG795_07305 [Acidimicrobiia bacterium]|nr:hypothetical protein [Acidimicrobiia bacterium]
MIIVPSTLSVISPRRALGANNAAVTRTRLSLSRYAVLTGGGLALAVVQLALMPRWLSAYQFGLVVLAISATQGVAQLGDLGLVRIAIDASRSASERAALRRQGRALTLLITTALGVAIAFLWPLIPAPQRPALVAVALGGLAAFMVVTDKYRAARQEVAGDEVGAAGLNFLWTNAPKIGLLVGLLVARSATVVTLFSVVVGALLCAPRWPGYRSAWDALKRLRIWTVPFVAIAGSFVLTWSDTYFLSAHLGVSEAAGYEALYRILGVSTYGFLPWVSVLTSRVSVRENRPVLVPLLLALGATAVGLTGATAFVKFFADSFFPHLALPLEALPPLLAFYLLLPISYCLGSALYVRARARAVTWATAASAAVALTGHVVFTLRGGPVEAAAVAAAAMAVAVVAQAVTYLRSGDDDRLLPPEGGGLPAASGPGVTPDSLASGA